MTGLCPIWIILILPVSHIEVSLASLTFTLGMKEWDFFVSKKTKNPPQNKPTNQKQQQKTPQWKTWPNKKKPTKKKSWTKKLEKLCAQTRLAIFVNVSNILMKNHILYCLFYYYCHVLLLVPLFSVKSVSLFRFYFQKHVLSWDHNLKWIFFFFFGLIW